MASFTVTGGYDNKILWIGLEGVCISNGLLLTFQVLGDTDASVCVTDEHEVVETRSKSAGDGVPAYIVRYANYQNTKTLLGKRDEGVVCQAKHDKLLSKDKFTLLWLNISMENNTATISAGEGLPSKATCLISFVDNSSTFVLSRIGFTTWGSSIKVQNLRVTPECFRPIDMLPLQCPETVALFRGMEAWGPQMVNVKVEDVVTECPILLLHCSDLCRRKLLVMEGSTITLEGVLLRTFTSWYESVQRFLQPTPEASKVMGTSTSNIRRLHISRLLENSRMAEMQLVGTGDTDAAHVFSYVLRRHSYFKRMLDSEWEESSMLSVSFDTPLNKELAEAIYLECFNVPQKLSLRKHPTDNIVSLAEICTMLGLEHGTSSCEKELIDRVKDCDNEFLMLCTVANKLCLKSLRTKLIEVLSGNIGQHAGSTSYGVFSELPQDVLAEALLHCNNSSDRRDSLVYNIAQTCLQREWCNIVMPPSSMQSVKDTANPAQENTSSSRGKVFSLGTGGVLDYLKKNNERNIAKQRAVVVTTSSPKNPLSAGWKLFGSRPQIRCTCTKLQKAPFVSVKFTSPLVGVVFPSHYEFAQGNSCEPLTSWTLKGKLKDGAWVTLDRQSGRLLYPFQPVHYELSCCFSIIEVQLVRTDGAEDLTVTHFELYGMVTTE
eukprot:TRINITY_DN26813_c0_g1_i1.p1 TRINITY_DN26813_c0_g1~~TRINITY_DN26813_c0_g1_i1.p1  ORF type:complete len:661 (+),score=77.53 TRINITY_DN26813_c0_g1_i1:36-2018(+)